MQLDRDTYYRALRARDPRFDGRIFVGVRSTGIYCRPICPARCPKLENVTFYASAAAAAEAGFRPCLRCRPEASPELAAWRGTSNTVARALALISGGALDGDDASVDRLAERLGVGERQLRRLFEKHLGASPIAVAQTRRVHFAKQLLHETRMKMVDVAAAAGFGSLRRFNDTFRRMYGRPPSALRRQSKAAVARMEGSAAIELRLPYAPPYDWEALIEFLAARAIPGVEWVEPRRYARAFELGGEHGTVEVAPIAGRDALSVGIRFPNVRALPEIVARVRHVFDLGADVSTIGAQLSEDPELAPLIAARPGLRVPSGWDGFELAVRAVLGQQVTVGAARQLAAKLVSLQAEPLASDLRTPNLHAVFPSADRLAEFDFVALGMPRARANALHSLARAAAADPRMFQPDRDLDRSVARLCALPGIGEWTAQYIALRALREPDAFPASDIGLLRALARADGTRLSPAQLLARAESWRPWRAYAAQHLWTADALGTGAGRPPARDIAA